MNLLRHLGTEGALEVLRLRSSKRSSLQLPPTFGATDGGTERWSVPIPTFSDGGINVPVPGSLVDGGGVPARSRHVAKSTSHWCSKRDRVGLDHVLCDAQPAPFCGGAACRVDGIPRLRKPKYCAGTSKETAARMTRRRRRGRWSRLSSWRPRRSQRSSSLRSQGA